MKPTVTLCTVLIALLISQQQVGAGGNDRKNAIVAAVERTQESIVTVKRRTASGEWEVAGTGVIIDECGLIITNRHVVIGSRGIVVCLSDKTEFNADILMTETQYDLAALRVKADRPLSALRLAPTQDLMVGEDVVAVGHPFGYLNSVSRGIISALEREIELPSGDVVRGIIQTDASINPGNSGGPLLNINGELIGINLAIRESARGIAFALNSTTVEKVLGKHFSASNVSGVSHGLTTEPKMIAKFGDRQRLALTKACGDLQPGDQILTVAHRPVGNSFELERALWRKMPGENVKLTIVRQGREIETVLTLSPSRKAAAVEAVAIPSGMPSGRLRPASLLP